MIDPFVEKFAGKDYGWMIHPKVEPSGGTVTLSAETRISRFYATLSIEDARALAAELLEAAEWAERKERA